MKIKKNVEMPTNIGRNRLGESSLALMEFWENGDKNIKFECESKREANAVYSTVFSTAKRYGLDVKLIKSMNDIYVVRKESE